MISVDRVYKTVLVIANSDIRGNATPSDIRLLINNTVEDIFESYFVDLAQSENRQNRGLMSSGITNWKERLEEKILYFLAEESITEGNGVVKNVVTVTLPDDLRYLETLFDNNGTEIDKCKSGKEFNLVKGYSTTSYPIYLLNDSVLKITPSSVEFPIAVSYLRKPVMANWAYNVLDGAETANPSASDYKDIDLHPSEESNVILKTLSKLGINLQEKDLQVVAQAMDNQKSNQEITS